MTLHLNLDNFYELLPGSLYWKNKDGVYLEGNHYLKKKTAQTAQALGSVIGKTDHCVFPQRVADQFRDTDLEVMKQKRLLVRKEGLILVGNKALQVVSSKKPAIDEQGDIIGVIGMSVYLTGEEEDTPPPLKLSPYLKQEVILMLPGKWKGSYLTRRQAECAYYLCRGKTIKGIAATLSLSPRTVEEYLHQLKIKLGCFKKSALIEIIWSSGIIFDLIEFVR